MFVTPKTHMKRANFRPENISVSRKDRFDTTAIMTKMYVLQWNAILPNEKSTPIRIIISTSELHNTEQLSAQYFDHECIVHMHNYIHNLLVLLHSV